MAPVPEETTAIDYVMEAASGAHFSGLRFDGLLTSGSASPRASPTHTPTHFSTTTPLDSTTPKQPFVIGNSSNSQLIVDFFVLFSSV